MDGYHIPLEINNGMAYLLSHPPTSHALETLPQIIMRTADFDWNPSIFNNYIDDVETSYDASDDLTHYGALDQCREYRYRTITIHNTRYEPYFLDTVEFLD
jgi:hypothetical protein